MPEPTERERVAIRLLPLGSKKWWSDDRIEKFIADTAARAKEQIAAEKERQVPDFGRYIKEWALQYGFSAEEARAEIERWVTEVQRKEDDFYKLGLAAFAEKNFGKAEELFRESAAVNAQRMRESERRIEEEKQHFEDYREATIRDYRLAGDAAYNDYAFTKALDAYRAALSFTDRTQRPRQWAEVTMDIANANKQISIRTKGPAVQQHLAQAVAAYRAALQVRTRELLPQDWAMTQNNLGAALGEQGIRTGGEEGRRLLAQALDAFRGALGIYQAAGAGHYVQIIERNIALTEPFISAASDPDAQFTLGVLYARGQAVEQDDAKAVQWLRKAAVQGHGQAQLFLGVMILSGRGVDQDDISGYAWIHLSAENGLEDALELRGQLQTEMDPSKRQDAERLSERLLQVEGENKPETRREETGPED